MSGRLFKPELLPETLSERLQSNQELPASGSKRDPHMQAPTSNHRPTMIKLTSSTAVRRRRFILHDCLTLLSGK